MKNEEITIAYLADGRSVHTQRFLSYFAERGYNIHLISYTPVEMKNVHVHKVATSKLQIPLRVVQSLNLIRKINPDILHAFYITNNGVVAALSGFHPLILSAWGSDIGTDPEKSGVIRFFIRLALKTADLVETSDEPGRKRLMELGCDSKKIFLQNMGVDTTLFSPAARSVELRKGLGIDNSYSVICARSWRSDYHVEVLIRAIPLVLEKVSNVKFILLGGGMLENELKKLAARLRVHENVSFVGRIPEEEMPKYLASVDVYVDTVTDYRFDFFGRILKAGGGGGMGQTTRQVMACGTPHILSDNISVRSADWFQGLMYKQLDHQDLAEKIVQLLSDQKLRRNIGEKSRKVALEICNLEKIMKKWENIYQQLTESTEFRR